jgi:fatty acid desaturase
MYKISETTRQRIWTLQEIRPAHNFFIFLYMSLWVVGALFILEMPSRWLALPGYLLVGFAIQSLAIMMHEGVHSRMFDPRKRFGRALNRWVGVVLAMPILFSASAYKASHLHHHRHERSIEDIDEWENLTRRPWLLKTIILAWLSVGAWLYPLHTAYHGFCVADRKTRRDILVEYVLLVATFGMLFYLVPGRLMLHLWLIPGIVTAVVTQVRGVTEHLLTPGDDPMRSSRTVVSNRFVSLMMANHNYHLEHHLFPAVPWYNLRKVHELLRADCVAVGSCVETSYLGYLWAFLKVILRPVPSPEPIPNRPGSYYLHYMPVVWGNAISMNG